MTQNYDPKVWRTIFKNEIMVWEITERQYGLIWILLSQKQFGQNLKTEVKSWSSQLKMIYFLSRPITLFQRFNSVLIRGIYALNLLDLWLIFPVSRIRETCYLLLYFDDYFCGNVEASNIHLFKQKPNAEYVDVIWQNCWILASLKKCSPSFFFLSWLKVKVSMWNLKWLRNIGTL